LLWGGAALQRCDNSFGLIAGSSPPSTPVASVVIALVKGASTVRLHCAAIVTVMTIMTTSTWRPPSMSSQNWTVAEAKAKFSEIIERAMSEGPQTITRNGRTAAVLVGAEEWQRKTQRLGSLAEFLAESPLRESGLKIRRLKDHARKTDL
jgi:prevent-host-death family protein